MYIAPSIGANYVMESCKRVGVSYNYVFINVKIRILKIIPKRNDYVIMPSTELGHKENR